MRLPEVGPAARLRLWIRYQRYGVLLVGVPAAAVALAMACAPWWLAALAVVAGVPPARFGIEVLARWPRKLRTTRIALARIESGRFAVTSVKGACGDPCYRIVADEILARAGLTRSERRRLIRHYAEQHRRERDVRVLIDHVRGTVVTYGGDAREGT